MIKDKNSDSRNNKFLFDSKEIEVIQVLFPRPTNKSLKIKPKKILKKLKKNKGTNIKKGESCDSV